jgi:hypothetical protein
MSRGIVIHSEVAAAFKELNMAQRGELITALLSWANGEKYEIQDATVLPFWGWLKKKQQEISEKYESTCMLRREIGKKGLSKRWQKVANDSKTKQKVAKLANPNPNPNPNPRSSDEDCPAASAVQATLKGIPAGKRKIGWDAADGTFTGITAEDGAAWAKAYPAVDAERETARAALWLTENPRRMKKDLRRFIGAWLRRAQGDAEAGGGGKGGRMKGEGGRRAGEGGGLGFDRGLLL